MKTLHEIQERIRHLKTKPISEADTGRLIIEPILQLLGYDLFDWDMVREQVAVQEGSTKGNTGQVDYGLRLNGRFVYMVEAKKLGSNDLNDPAQIKKANDYCNHSDRPRFAIITDGQRWKLYDHTQGGRPTERLIFDVDLLGQKPQMIHLLSPNLYKELLAEAKIIKEVKTSAVDDSVSNILIKRSLDSLLALCPKGEATEVSKVPSKESKSGKATESLKPLVKPKLLPKGTKQIAYGEYPPNSVQPVQLTLVKDSKAIKISVTKWSQVLVEFVKAFEPQDPKSLIGWKMSPRTKVALFSDTNETGRYKEVFTGVWMNTTYSAPSIMRQLNALIDHLGLDKGCYSVFYAEKDS